MFVATPFQSMMAARQPQGLHALRNSPDIARFVIEGEANGRQLGTGSYGSVEEVSLVKVLTISYIAQSHSAS